MDLDERQLVVAKKFLRAQAEEVLTMPADKAAQRCEEISVMAASFGWTEFAECAREASFLYGEGDAAGREMLNTVLKSKEDPA